MLNSSVESIAELLSIALDVQRETIARYAALAAQMKSAGNAAVGQLYAGLAADEQGREQRLTEWADLAGHDLVTASVPRGWEDDPGVPTLYDADAIGPLSSTPYKVLAYAVHDKQRGFRFFSYIAADTTNSDVSELAEMLAREELGQASLLRGQRRLAWHAERTCQQAEPHIEAGSIESTADLIAVVVCFENLQLQILNTLEADTPLLEAVRAQRLQQLSHYERSADSVDSVNIELKSELDGFKLWHERELAGAQDSSGQLARLRALADTGFVLYDTVVNNTQDEKVMLLAQKQAGHALDFIGSLGDMAQSLTPDRYEL